MGYDRGDTFPFDFEPNGVPFGSKSKGKVSPRSYPIQCERKYKYCFLTVPVFFIGGGGRWICMIIYATVYHVNPIYFSVFYPCFYQFAGQNKPKAFQI